jgi:hypothetical protein
LHQFLGVPVPFSHRFVLHCTSDQVKKVDPLSVFSLLTRSQENCGYPIRTLAIAIAIVVLTLGILLPLQGLGILSLFLKAPIFPGAVLSTTLAGAILSAVLLTQIKLIHEQGDCPVPNAGLSRATNLVVALTVIIYAALLLDCLISFPNGYDPMAYHIDVALKWLQTGSMRLNPSWGWKYSLSSNAELPALIALSAGLTKAISLGNLLAGLLLSVSVYLLAWRITRDGTASLLTAITSITIPMVIYQAFELDVDLFGTSFLMASIALLFWRDKSRMVCTLLSGCAMGTAVGTKPVFWVYCSIFAVAAFATVLTSRPQRLKGAVLLTAGILLPSGFWFLRSMVATGNPLYPMKLSIGGHEVLRGYNSTDITAPSFGFGTHRQLLVQPWKEPPRDNGLPVGYDRGTGPLFAAIALPGTLFLIIRTLRGRGSRREVFLLLGAAAAFVCWDTLLLGYVRFALPVLAIACALAAPMIQAILNQNWRVSAGMFVLGVTLNGLFCLAQPAMRIARRFERHDWSRSTYYGYPPMIDKLPVGSRIIDRTDRMSFALAGADLTNYVEPEKEMGSADYVAEATDPHSKNPPAITQGATLLYDAEPPTLYPKVTLRWRIYRLH